MEASIEHPGLRGKFTQDDESIDETLVGGVALAWNRAASTGTFGYWRRMMLAGMAGGVCDKGM